MACVHMMVDGYGNIFAPLLPLLIPRLDLTLAAAGTLTMLFQLSASVAQIGFGHLADRWRPRLLVMMGPVIAVSVLSFVGAATSPLMLAVILIVGGLGGASFHPPAAALAHRLGGARPGFTMSVYITGGTLGFSLGPLLFAPFAQRFGLAWTPLLALPGLAVVAFFLRHVPPMSAHTLRRRGLPCTETVRAPPRPPVFHRRAADPGGHIVRHVPPGHADASRDVADGFRFRGGSVSVRERSRWVRGRSGRGSVRIQTGHCPVARARRAVSLRRADAHGLAVSGRHRHRRVLSAVDVAGQCHVRPDDCPRERGHRVVLDDGLRVGNGWAFRCQSSGWLPIGSGSNRRCAGLRSCRSRRPPVPCRSPDILESPRRPVPQISVCRNRDLGAPEP